MVNQSLTTLNVLVAIVLLLLIFEGGPADSRAAC